MFALVLYTLNSKIYKSGFHIPAYKKQDLSWSVFTTYIGFDSTASALGIPTFGSITNMDGFEVQPRLATR